MGDSENKEVLQNEAVAENKQADNAVDTKKADKPVKKRWFFPFIKVRVQENRMA